jgi:hypothetical protein
MTTRRVSAELSGDDAIKLEILFAATRLAGEQKKEADSLFCKLAILSVEKVIAECKDATGVQYPSHSQLIEFLTPKIDH